MGNLVEMMKKNIDAVAVAAACLAVFVGSHSTCLRPSFPEVRSPSAIHAIVERVLELPGARCVLSRDAR